MSSPLAFRSALAALVAAVVTGSLSLPAQAAEPGKSHRATQPAARHGTQARQTPLRYDPPAAGPAASDAAYDACIDHPSPDGLTMDCQALQRPAPAKPHRKP